MFSLPIIFLAAAVTAMLIVLGLTASPLDLLRRVKNTDDTEAYDPATDQRKAPSLTVVVYDFDRSTDPRPYLEALFAQDYPNFSVVVVADTSATESAEMRKRLSADFPDVHFTFIPPGSHNLSRRKLAFTLGIKAAKGEYVLTTASNCLMQSPRWLSLMMTPVISNPQKEVVLGLTRPDFSPLSGLKRRYRQFDFTQRTLQWLSAATRRPIRGDGFNLLFRRSLFFEAKGYSRSVHLNPGDDDIFLTEIATRENTAIQISPEARLTQEWGDITDKALLDLRERYSFTARKLPKVPFLQASMVSWAQWIVLGGAVAATLLTLPQWIPAATAAAILLCFWIMEITLYRVAAPWIGSTRLLWALVPFLLWHPIGNFMFRMRRWRHTRLQYTCRY